MTEKLPINTGKVTTEEQIHRIGARLINRANDMRDVIEATNTNHDSDAGTKENRIEVADSRLKYEATNPTSGFRNTIKIQGGEYPILDAQLPTTHTGPSESITVGGSGNHYYAAEGNMDQFDMSDKMTRHTAAQSLDAVRKELNRRAASVEKSDSSTD